MERSSNNFNDIRLLREAYEAVLDGTVRDVYGKTCGKRELLSMAKRFHSFMGTKKCVALCAPASLESIAAILSTLLYGKTLYLINEDTSLVEIERRLSISPVDAVIFEDSKAPIGLGCDVKILKLSDIFLGEKKVSNACFVEDKECCDIQSKIVLFTTGTSGYPKGVVLTVSNIKTDLISFHQIIKIKEDDKVAVVSPISHAMGFITCMLGIFLVKDISFSNSQFDTIRILLYDTPDFIALSPILINLLAQNEIYIKAFEKIKYLFFGGAAMLNPQLREMLKNRGVNLLNGYGMTEAVAVVAVEDPFDNKHDNYLTCMSCCEIALALDGELLVRGDNIAERYLDGKLVVDENGWYHTKDYAEIREGKIRILSRNDAVIVLSNGYKIDAEKVEERVNRLPGIIDSRAFKKQINGLDRLCVELVLLDKTLREENILSTINAHMEYFEKVASIEIVDSLTMQGGKKKRG